MRKYVIAIIAVVALLASTMPVSADTAFNDMSKCVQSWGKGCGGSASTAAATPAMTQPRPKTAVDAIGNVTPTATDNSGKTKLGQ